MIMNTDKQAGPNGDAASLSRDSEHAKVRPQEIGSKSGAAVSKLADAAQSAGQQAMTTATSLASEANEKAKGMMNQQVAAGADWVGHLAEAAKAAADNLKQNAPQLSGLVRDAAAEVEKFSKTVKGQSVEELYRSASDFTRRQPAVVFGSAALFGFFISRLLKTESARGSSGTGGGRKLNDDTYRTASSPPFRSRSFR
jgi:ElaB/YqjD/DUF883 family membrane-anchored ribosome-binding protein